MRPSILGTGLFALVVALAGCDPTGPGVKPPVSGTSPAPSAHGGAVSGVAKYEAIEAPHAGITVRLTAPGFAAETTTDPSGKYRFTGLEAGTYELRYERQRYFPATRSVEVEDATASVPSLILSNHRLLYETSALYDQPHVASLTSLVLAPGGDRLAFVEGGVLKTLPLAGGAPAVVRDLQPAPGTIVDSFDWTAAGLAYAQVEAGATSSLFVTSGADPLGPLSVATTSARLMICPAFSPSGTEFAYMAHVAEPWSLPNGDGTFTTGEFHLTLVKQARGSSEGTRVGRYAINGSWNYGFGPLSWTAAGLLFHKPMFCDIYQNAPTDNPAGDGIYLVSPSNGALKKLYYYSNYEHCLSPDDQILYFHEGRRVYGRRVDDPRAYNLGHYIVGYDRTGMIGNLVMGPAGDRLYYVSSRGIEEMTLLVPANE